MKKIKIELTHDEKVLRTEEGDFGIIGVGHRQHGGKPLVDVSFSNVSEEEVIYLVATILIIAAKVDPLIPIKAFELFIKQTKIKKKQ